MSFDPQLVVLTDDGPRRVSQVVFDRPVYGRLHCSLRTHAQVSADILAHIEAAVSAPSSSLRREGASMMGDSLSQQHGQNFDQPIVTDGSCAGAATVESRLRSYLANCGILSRVPKDLLNSLQLVLSSPSPRPPPPPAPHFSSFLPNATLLPPELVDVEISPAAVPKSFLYPPFPEPEFLRRQVVERAAGGADGGSEEEEAPLVQGQLRIEEMLQDRSRGSPMLGGGQNNNEARVGLPPPLFFP